MYDAVSCVCQPSYRLCNLYYLLKRVELIYHFVFSLRLNDIIQCVTDPESDVDVYGYMKCVHECKLVLSRQ